MKAVFADTYYFLALVNGRDPAHKSARDFSRHSTREVVTTHWVLTEVGDALCKGPNRGLFVFLIEDLQQDRQSRIIPASQALFNEGLKLFSNRPDKDWSLTDCMSFAAMAALGLSEALTGDHHFEQAGFVALLK